MVYYLNPSEVHICPRTSSSESPTPQRGSGRKLLLMLFALQFKSFPFSCWQISGNSIAAKNQNSGTLEENDIFTLDITFLHSRHVDFWGGGNKTDMLVVFAVAKLR